MQATIRRDSDAKERNPRACCENGIPQDAVPAVQGDAAGAYRAECEHVGDSAGIGRAICGRA